MDEVVYPRRYYVALDSFGKPWSCGYAVNSDFHGVALRDAHGCSWHDWKDVKRVSVAEAVNLWGL